MGFFSSIGSAISSAFSSVCIFVGRICSSIAGALGGTVLGQAVTSFVSKIGLAIPGLNIIATIIQVANIIVKIAEILGLKKENEDEPDELAMKAEKDDKKPEDFDSVEEYINHLHNDIELSKEDKEKLDKMSPEERGAYRATGTYLYTKACNEKLGFDTTGLKNPDLIGINSEILTDLLKIGSVFTPSDFVICSKYLAQSGLNTKQLSDYLHNRSENISVDEKVKNAIKDTFIEQNPDISKPEILQKLYQMNIED